MLSMIIHFSKSICISSTKDVNHGNLTCLGSCIDLIASGRGVLYIFNCIIVSWLSQYLFKKPWLFITLEKNLRILECVNSVQSSRWLDVLVSHQTASSMLGEDRCIVSLKSVKYIPENIIAAVTALWHSNELELQETILNVAAILH
jgi:hypothetical protein